MTRKRSLSPLVAGSSHCINFAQKQLPAYTFLEMKGWITKQLIGVGGSVPVDLKSSRKAIVTFEMQVTKVSACGTPQLGTHAAFAFCAS
jgi:hypothetical protein